MNPHTLLSTPSTFATPRDFVLAAEMARLASEGDPRVVHRVRPIISVFRRLCTAFAAIGAPRRATAPSPTREIAIVRAG